MFQTEEVESLCIKFVNDLSNLINNESFLELKEIIKKQKEEIDYLNKLIDAYKEVFEYNSISEPKE